MTLVRFLILILLSSTLVSCSPRSPAQNISPSPTPSEATARVEVTVAKARVGSLLQEYRAVGNVDTPSKTDISPRVSGQVTGMEILKNRHVEQGQVLAVLAQGDLAAQKLQAQAALTEARLNLQNVRKVNLPQSSAQLGKSLADAQALYGNTESLYQRRLELYQKGGFSLKDLQATELSLDNARSSLKLARENLEIHKSGVVPNAIGVAQARIEQAQERIAALDAQIGQTVVRAPISGTVTEQYLYQGDFASQGVKILSLADLSDLIVKVSVPDNLAAQLSEGLKLQILSQSNPDEKLDGYLSLISLSTNRSNRTVEVWCKLDEPKQHLLKMGDAVEVVFKVERPDTVLVPRAAVTLDSPDSSSGVIDIVDSQSKAQEVKVTVGQSNNREIEILTGLSGSEEVIVDGNFQLPSGTEVKAGRKS